MCGGRYDIFLIDSIFDFTTLVNRGKDILSLPSSPQAILPTLSPRPQLTLCLRDTPLCC